MEKTTVHGGLVARSNDVQEFCQAPEHWLPCHNPFLNEVQLPCLFVEAQMLIVKFIQTLQIESETVHLINQSRVQAWVDMYVYDSCISCLSAILNLNYQIVLLLRTWLCRLRSWIIQTGKLTLKKTCLLALLLGGILAWLLICLLTGLLTLLLTLLWLRIKIDLNRVYITATR